MKRREGLFVDVTPPTANRATWTDWREATTEEIVEHLLKRGATLAQGGSVKHVTNHHDWYLVLPIDAPEAHLGPS